MKASMKDPITGDELSRLEYWTRQIQVAVRTPWFILFFNLVTLLSIVLHQMLAWNDMASWLAIFIEWLVGTYMFGQTGRDAIVMRAIRRELIEVVEHLVREQGRRLEEIWKHEVKSDETLIDILRVLQSLLVEKDPQISDQLPLDPLDVVSYPEPTPENLLEKTDEPVTNHRSM